MATDALLHLHLHPHPAHAAVRARGADEPLEALAQRMDDHALIVLDRAGRVRGWSPGAERLSGYTRDEALGRHVSVFYPAEDLRSGAPGREVEDALSGRVEVEGWWTRKDGTRMWGRRVLSPLPGPGGEAEGVGVVVCDLTGTQEAHRRLHEREECYRSLFEHTPDAVCTLDVHGRITGANAACEAVTGLRARELLGRPFEALAEPGDRERVREAAARCARGEPRSTELALRRRGGGRLALEATLVPIIVGGQPAGVFVVARDATGRRRREAEQRAGEERFRRLVEEGSAGFFYDLDDAGRFRYVSPAAAAVTGYAPAELVGRAFAEALDAEPAAGGGAGGEAFTVAVRTSAGEPRWLEVVESPAAGEEGGRRGFAWDVTRRRELERRHAHALDGDAAALPDRALFGERVARAIRVSARDPGRMLAVLVVALAPADPGGDRAAAHTEPVEVAARLERCLRPGDAVCRLDGAEFGVLLDGIREPDDAFRVARRIEATLEAPLPGDLRGAAVGVAVSAAGRETADELLRSAGAALQAARAMRA
jgi:PAS domain S-box-containing protein